MAGPGPRALVLAAAVAAAAGGWPASARAAVRGLLPARPGPARPPTLLDVVRRLPLVATRPASARDGLFVVMFSGDGGWADIDRTIASDLVDAGWPVLGIDALQWFLLGRSPGRSAGDLAAVLDYGRTLFGADRVVVFGYSRGAETLPFMLRRLDDAHRSPIKVVMLAGAGRSTDFLTLLIHRPDGSTPSWALQPVAPELDAIRSLYLVGVYGEQEAGASVCTQVPADFRAVYALPGGHHFNGNTRTHDPYHRIASLLEQHVRLVLGL